MGQFSKPVIKCGGSTAFTKREIDLTKKSKPLRFDLSGQPGTVIRFEIHYEAGSRGVREYQGKRTADIVGHFTAPELIISGDKKSDFVEYIPSKKAVPGIIKVRVSFKPEKKPRQSLRSFNIVIKGYSFSVKVDGSRLSAYGTTHLNLPYRSGNTENYCEQLKKFSFSGPERCSIRLYMTWNGTSCGHHHNSQSMNEKATGFFTNFKHDGNVWKSDFTLPPGGKEVDCQYTTYGVSGITGVQAILLNAQGVRVDMMRFSLDVRYARGGGFHQLEESSDYGLIGDNTHHPENHYGTQELINAVTALARAFKGRFGESAVGLKQLWINDMSLRYGGRFDCWSDRRREFQWPHQLHMFGEHVDIHSKSHTEEQKQWILNNAIDSHLDIELEHKGETNEHFHAIVT